MHNSAKIVDVQSHVVTFLVLCTLSDSGLKFHENIFDGFKIIERSRFSYEKFQRDTINQKM